MGIVPDQEWFQYNQVNKTGLVRLEGAWSGGDLMNMAIGQGAMVCTPLQLANGYAALVNGGTLWRPRVVAEIRDSDGDAMFLNVPSVLGMVDIAPETVASLKADLHGVVASEKGTAYAAFQELRRQPGPGGGQDRHRADPPADAAAAGRPQRRAPRARGGNWSTSLALLLGVPVEEMQAQFEAQEAGASFIARRRGDRGEPRTSWRSTPATSPESPSCRCPRSTPPGSWGWPRSTTRGTWWPSSSRRAGSGGKIAAPTARAILQFLMGEEVDTIRTGQEAD